MQSLERRKTCNDTKLGMKQILELCKVRDKEKFNSSSASFPGFLQTPQPPHHCKKFISTSVCVPMYVSRSVLFPLSLSLSLYLSVCLSCFFSLRLCPSLSVYLTI